MRVLTKHRRQVARHMGRCQPGRAMQYLAVGFIKTPKGELKRGMRQFLSAFIAHLQLGGMALHKIDTPDAFRHSFELSGQMLAEKEHSLVLWRISQRNSCLVVNWTMQRERLRMSSRRGSSRGRASTKRPAISPSSSVEVTTEQNRSQGKLAGHGNVLGWGEIMDCGHTEHPTVRYRIPCTLENTTLIVSVSVEHYSNFRGQLEDLHGNPPQVQRTAPIVDMQVPVVDMQRPTRESTPPATQAACAGPSELAQRTLLSDSEESQKFKCKVEDEPYTTDDE